MQQSGGLLLIAGLDGGHTMIHTECANETNADWLPKKGLSHYVRQPLLPALAMEKDDREEYDKKTDEKHKNGCIRERIVL